MVTVLNAHVLTVVMVDSVPIAMTALTVHATIVVMVATVLSVLMEVPLMVVLLMVALLMAIVLNVRVLTPMVVEDRVDMAVRNNDVHRIMIRMQSTAVRSR